MAALDANGQLAAIRHFVRSNYAELAQTATLNSVQVAEVVADIDAWIEANPAAFNTSIRQPQRATLTLPEKGLLLAAVALAKAGLL